MNFDDKYPNARLNQLLGDNMLKQQLEGECVVCSEYTKWQFCWSKRSYFGIHTVFKKHICSDNCLEYYDVMKGLM